MIDFKQLVYVISVDMPSTQQEWLLKESEEQLAIYRPENIQSCLTHSAVA